MSWTHGIMRLGLRACNAGLNPQVFTAQTLAGCIGVWLAEAHSPSEIRRLRLPQSVLAFEPSTDGYPFGGASKMRKRPPSFHRRGIFDCCRADCIPHDK